MKIWWLTQKALEPYCARDFLNRRPKYLWDQALSLVGRSGRGRLWVAPELGDVQVPYEAFETPVGVWILAENMGGVVVKDEDAGALVELPGFLTDLELRRWPALPGANGG